MSLRAGLDTVKNTGHRLSSKTMAELAQQVVVITGASAGIGAALARRLAQRFPGITLVLAARNAEKLAAIATDCTQAGATVLVVPTNMAEVDQAQTLAQKALDHFGRIDALVNNAGYGQMGPLELLPAAACQRQFSVNLLGPLALTQAVIPSMRSQGGGRIVNVSSLGGRTAFPLGGLYSASKFALEAMSDVLRMELEPFNIQVSVVEPGPVSTEFFAVVNQEVAATLPQPEQTPYRAALRKLAQLEAQTAATVWSAERVADVLIRALGDRPAHPRYIAATGGHFLVFLLTKLLPTWAVDRFWQRFYGINDVANDWKAFLKKP
jgi:short-subunit dehydrogenase